jgi:hypothetical protein
MARVTKKRKDEIKKFTERWEPWATDKRNRNEKCNPIVLAVAIKMIKELIGEERN